MIRLATIADLPAVAAFGPAAAETAKLPGQFNPGTWVPFWLNMLAQKAGFILLNEQVCQNGALRLRGALGGTIFTSPDFGHKICAQLFMMKDPKAKGGCMPLVPEFEKEAKRRGAQAVSLIATFHDQFERVDSAFKRRGYQATEVCYSKKI